MRIRVVPPRLKARIKGAHGDLISLADLPEPKTRHWGLAVKARVVAAVEGGLISPAQVCARYEMCFEEYLEWRACVIARAYRHLDWLSETTAAAGSPDITVLCSND